MKESLCILLCVCYIIWLGLYSGMIGCLCSLFPLGVLCEFEGADTEQPWVIIPGLMEVQFSPQKSMGKNSKRNGKITYVRTR